MSKKTKTQFVKGLSIKDFTLAKQNLEEAEMKLLSSIRDDFVPSPNLTATQSDERYKQVYDYYFGKSPATPEQKGINPMAYNNSPTTAAATIAVAPSKSDAQIQREYLLSRLDSLVDRWEDAPRKIRDQLRKQFNLDDPQIPTNPLELIDLIKTGKYTLDQKKIDRVAALKAEYEEDDVAYDPFSDYSLGSFITFEGYPKADRDGYQKAIEAYRADTQKARDTVMVADAATALATIQALEDWTPPAAQIAAPN